MLELRNTAPAGRQKSLEEATAEAALKVSSPPEQNHATSKLDKVRAASIQP